MNEKTERRNQLFLYACHEEFRKAYMCEHRYFRMEETDDGIQYVVCEDCNEERRSDG